MLTSFTRILLALALVHATARGGVAGGAPPTARLARTVRIARGAPISLRATVGDIAVIGWDRPGVEIEIARRKHCDAAARASARKPRKHYSVSAW